MSNARTRYITSSTIDDEVKYIQGLLGMMDRYPGYNHRLPPSLEQAIKVENKREFSPDVLRQAIAEDPVSVTGVEEMQEEWNAQAPAIHSEFLSRMSAPSPSLILIHITKYGVGGSFHPLRRHPLSTAHPAISVMDKKLLSSIRSFNQTIVHESVELAMFGRVQGISHQAKEATVDKICSCDELQAIYGKYAPQPQFVNDLPTDWRERVAKLWKEGGEPSWS